VKGYHCWAYFMPKKPRLVPRRHLRGEPASRSGRLLFGNLTENRIQFTTGRDNRSEPEAGRTAAQLLRLPYAEVDGQPYPADKIQRTFSYKDI